jgi:hypothetical protein
MISRKTFSAAVIPGILLSLGCGGGSSPVSNTDPKSETIHILKAGALVRQYIGENKGKVPKDTSEMKDWAAKNNISDDDLASTRDHEPYEIHEVVKGPMRELILTESKGVKSKKFFWKDPSMEKKGVERTQEQIDLELKPNPGQSGRPPSGGKTR